ncbi:MAG: radical SAM protein [Bacteroidaceae bacterium]|nr:radical SAM protein [Bacteroidaceae bacterium]
MHYIEAKSILTSFHGGMNVYRGCTHGCVYCDARSKVYGMEHLFEDVAVKHNAPQLLEKALRSKRKPCMIGTGSMADPYQHCEEQLQITRKCLELIYRYGFGATLITKSDRVLRDIDILESINQRTKCVVQMSLTIMDDTLSRKMEPGVCPSSRRVEVLRELQDRGIPTVVWLCPVLPYISDTEENIKAILEACIQTGVKGIICFWMGMTLREGDREYYYAALDRNFPGLKQRYIQEYGNAYQLSSPNAAALMSLFKETCNQHGILSTLDDVFAYLREFPQPEQLTLF